MRKRIIIPDIHFNFDWVKEILRKENPDEVICLGDYFDSYDKTLGCSREKFEELAFDPRITLLLGNHDYHYLDISCDGHYSGYSRETECKISGILSKLWKEKKIQIIYIDFINQIIYSHAGVSDSWMSTYNLDLLQVNQRCYENPDYLRFTYRDGGDNSGSSKFNSPIWIRPGSLRKDGYQLGNPCVTWNQVVGHTPSDSPSVIRPREDSVRYDFIDCSQRSYRVEIIDEVSKTIKKVIYETDFREHYR